MGPMGGPHPTEARSASAEHQVVIGSRYCKSAWLVSRGVNDALSGLFGRLAARAHHEGYFNVSIFAYLGGRGIDLDRRRKVMVKRQSRGDLPGWIACSSGFSSLTVAEARAATTLTCRQDFFSGPVVARPRKPCRLRCRGVE